MMSLAIFFLTGFFSPDDIGQYSVVVILITFLSYFFSCRLDALVLIRPEKEARNLVELAKSLSFYFFVILQPLFIIAYFIYPYKVAFLFLPFFTYCFSLFGIVRELNIKLHHYRFDAIQNTVRGVILLVLQIGAGLVYPLIPLLNLGKSASEIYYVLISSPLNKEKKPRLPLGETLKQTWSYRLEVFPLLLNRVIQNLSNNSIPFLWSYFLGFEKTGLLYLALKIIQLPGNIIGETLAKLLEIKVTEAKPAQTKVEIYKMMAFSFAIALLASLAILIVSPFVIQHFFSSKWQTALPYIAYLTPIVGVNILNNCIISLYKFKQELKLFNHFELVEAVVKNVFLVVMLRGHSSDFKILLMFALLCLGFTVFKCVYSFIKG